MKTDGRIYTFNDIDKINEKLEGTGIYLQENSYKYGTYFVLINSNGENLPFEVANKIKFTDKEIKYLTLSDEWITIIKYKESKTMIVKNDKFTQNYTRVECENKEDQKFNAPHHYKVIDINNDKVVTEVNFQEGPIKENGINGMSNEDGILMIIDRLEHFQNSDWKCEENAEAIEYFYKGIDALRRRTNKRAERGVEGTSIK